jgi:hypothetical protein
MDTSRIIRKNKNLLLLFGFLPDLNGRPGRMVNPDEKSKSDFCCIPSCSSFSFDRFDFDLILFVCCSSSNANIS